MVAKAAPVVITLRKPLMTTSEVADLFSFTCQSVLRARRQGQLRGSRVGGRVLFHADDIADWINAQADGLTVVVADGVNA